MKYLLFVLFALTVVACIPKITKLPLQETDIERAEMKICKCLWFNSKTIIQIV